MLHRVGHDIPQGPRQLITIRGDLRRHRVVDRQGHPALTGESFERAGHLRQDRREVHDFHVTLQRRRFCTRQLPHLPDDAAKRTRGRARRLELLAVRRHHAVDHGLELRLEDGSWSRQVVGHIARRPAPERFGALEAVRH